MGAVTCWAEAEEVDGIEYAPFKDETELPRIMQLVGRDLSEPYSIFTYRYFIQGWPSLCQLVS
jgi:peptide alpha-N-acetyltransferase